MSVKKKTIKSTKTLAKALLENMTLKDMFTLASTGKLPLERVLKILSKFDFDEVPLPLFVEIPDKNEVGSLSM